MYIVSSLEYVIDRLFRCGVGDPGYQEEEVEELLQGMDYHSLLQAVRHEAKTVFAYTTQGKDPMAFNYRGADLFGQRATLLYTDFDQSDAGIVLADRRYELWLLEDMSLVVTACVSVEYGDNDFVTEYREIKQGDPWHTPMCLNLEDLSIKLTEMFCRCYENELPVYEL